MVRENKRKRYEVLHKSNADAGMDEISNLPDELIHHILSFLPTKCAISTCILSKRWKYVVNSIPILDFRDWRGSIKGTKKEMKLETKRFVNFLDTLLFIYEKRNIQKCYLDLDELFDESQVNRWICTITKRNVEKLWLRIKYPTTSPIFPLSFFTCDSLTRLSLYHHIDPTAKFIIPNTVYFPNLKKLRLINLSFVNEASTEKLFSNCPILEELSLFGCDMTEGLCIMNPALKHLFMDSCRLLKSTVKISAPNLLTFCYSGARPPADFVLDSFPSVTAVDVDFDINEGYEYGYKVFAKLFEKLASVKFLKICVYSFMVLTDADILLTNLPTFNNLIHLEVTSHYMDLDPVPMVGKFFRFLQLFFRLSPNLESIIFHESIHHADEEDDGRWLVDIQCSLPHLKSIEFREFQGKLIELYAIKLFLKYASFLQTVTIVASQGLSKDLQLLVTTMLLVFPKPANCVVKYLMSSEDN